MDDQDAEVMVLQAIAKEKEKTVRLIKKISLGVYGMQGHLLDLLRDDRIEQAIEELEEARKRCEDELINR